MLRSQRRGEKFISWGIRIISVTLFTRWLKLILGTAFTFMAHSPFLVGILFYFMGPLSSLAVAAISPSMLWDDAVLVMKDWPGQSLIAQRNLLGGMNEKNTSPPGKTSSSASYAVHKKTINRLGQFFGRCIHLEQVSV